MKIVYNIDIEKEVIEMFKRVLSFAVVFAMLLVLPAFVSGNQVTARSSAVTVSAANASPVQQGAMRARFLNMLNHNNIYDDDFMSDKTMIENAILSLLAYVQDGQIDKALVLNFIANMYGREVDENAAVYDFLPADDGKFAVLARGYSKLSHNIESITEVDGGYEVLSQMTLNPHDCDPLTVSVKTVFVNNATSTFGYNIVSSDILNLNVGDNTAL